MNYIDRSELEQWLEQLLQCHQYRDYCPNGLQLQGTKQIRHIVTGVTASLALIEKAIEQGADTLIVHHGWFWKNEDPCIVGMKQKRIATALKHGLNIFAYHLPLDGHPKLGNNTQLGYKLGFEAEHNSEGALKRIGPQNLIQLGYLKNPMPLEKLAKHIHEILQRKPQFVGKPQQLIRRIAWCTGGAQGFMPEAIKAKVDAYITGEASEHSYHYAQETSTAFIAAGHHATERYGVKALGEYIAQHFPLKITFIDIDNPF